jgi:hypothetical protein
VAKRKADPYQPETLWYKIKSRTYPQGERRFSRTEGSSPGMP